MRSYKNKQQQQTNYSIPIQTRRKRGENFNIIITLSFKLVYYTTGNKPPEPHTYF